VSPTLDLTEGMTIGLPVQVKQTPSIDHERMPDWDFDLPENVSFSRLDLADGMKVIGGGIGRGKGAVEIKRINESSSGDFKYIHAEVVEIEIIAVEESESSDSYSPKYRGHFNDRGEEAAEPRAAHGGRSSLSSIARSKY
jgi:hypothetical protein